MGEHTHISWCDHTFNPWIGCTKVSNGKLGACVGCYAENLMDTRYGRVTWGAPGQGNGTRVRTSVANWRKPLAWDRKAKADGSRPLVFCSSLADVFDNQIEPAWRSDLFELIRTTPNLVWLLLTKRPQNILQLYNGSPRDGETVYDWPRNAAIGCTVVTQAEADRDIPQLLAAKAALTPAFAFLSMEPLMGPVDIRWAISRNRLEIASGFQRRGMFSPGLETVRRVDWVITGGETAQGAHKARPSHPDWFRSLRDQCAAAAVVFHHKQNGEFLDGRRVGKTAAGRLLDGVAHDGRPLGR